MGIRNWIGERLAAAAVRVGLPAQTTGTRRAETQSVDELINIMTGNADPSGMPGTLSADDAHRSFARWQYAAATAIADAVMMSDLYVEERTGDTWERKDDHALAYLLRDANPWMTGEELIYWAVADCMMTGCSHWYIQQNNAGEPVELWPVVGKMTPVREKDSPLLTGWKLEVNDPTVGRYEKQFDPSEIVYLRLPLPGDVYGAFGPAQAASSAIRLDQQIIISEWQAFKRGLFPAALLKFDPQTPPDKRTKMLQEFDDKYGGAEKTGQSVGISRSMDVEFPQTKPREMGYQRGAEQVRDEILATFRVPPAILGQSKDVNRASAEGMEYVFAKWRVGPLLKLLCARLNQDLARPYWGRDVRITYTSPVPADRAHELAEDAADMDAFSLLINERREKRGLPAVKWGDVPWAPMSLAPLGSVPADGGGDGEQSATGVVTQATPRGRSAVQRRDVFQRFTRDRVRLETRVQRMAAGHFRDLGKRVLDAWDRAGQQAVEAVRRHLELPDEVERMLDPVQMRADLAKRAKPVNRWGLVVGGDFERGLFTDPAVPWGEGSEAIARYMAMYDDAYYHEVATVTRRQYMDAVAAGVQENETWDELRLRIVDAMGTMTEQRAANIATTETTKLYGAGGQAFRDEYEVTFKQWLAALINSRDTHVEADGQIVRNTELFTVGTDRMMFPGDGSLAEENCNCNCGAVGVVK